MTSPSIFYLCSGTIIGCGLVAGVFLTFSDFVMKSLGSARPEAGIEAMQIINRNVYGSVFLILLLGMAPVSILLAILAWFWAPGTPQVLIFAGSALYVAGVFGVTMICNVPMNKRLDTMQPAAPDTATYWRVYVRTWTRWNHIRTAAALGATTCFLVACLELAPGV